MYRVEGDVIHGVYKSLIFVVRNRITSMAFEREIAPEKSSDMHGVAKKKLAVNPSPQHTFNDAVLIAYSLEIWTTKLTGLPPSLLRYPQQSHY